MIVRETGAPSTPLSTSPSIIVNTIIITICCLNNRQSNSEQESQPKESMIVEEACPHRPLEQCVNPLLQFGVPHLTGLCWFCASNVNFQLLLHICHLTDLFLLFFILANLHQVQHPPGYILITAGVRLHFHL